MSVRRPARVLYSEGNVDGTVGGSYYSLLGLLEGLERTRVSPVLVLRADTSLLERFRHAAGDVRIIPRRSPLRFGERATPRLRWALRPAQQLLNATGFGVAVVRLARWLRRERIDLVHLNNSVTSNHDWMLAAMLARVPCLTHERGLNDTYSALARWCAPRLAAILCISRAVRDKLVERHVSRDNLELVPNGLDPRSVSPTRTADEVRTALGIGPDRRVIGMVGNIREWKGQEVVVRALARIRDRVPAVSCVFVGEATAADGDYVAKLRRLIDELGLRENVIFAGYYRDVADPLNIMEVAIHASVTPEPFGRVLLEAMALRRPVVGSRAGAVPEIVVDGVTGFTFAPGDETELADRVVRLLADPELASRFGAAGYRRVESEFHVSTNVERTLSIYGRILGW